MELYPQWQKFLRDHPPKTLIFWGEDDIFFTPAGGEAYLRDLPKAEIHRLKAGHFAVKDNLEYIASHIVSFYDKNVHCLFAFALEARSHHKLLQASVVAFTFLHIFRPLVRYSPRRRNISAELTVSDEIEVAANRAVQENRAHSLWFERYSRYNPV